MTTTKNPLDALLAIRNGFLTARWNFEDAVGTSIFSPGGIGSSADVTFSFLTSIPAYYSTTGFAPFTDFQKQAARAVLKSVAEMVSLNFHEVSGTGKIAFGMNSQPSSGYAFFPAYNYKYSGETIVSVTAQDLGGDVWLNSSNRWTAADFALGGSGYGTLVHEIGHALGLKHPFEAGNSNGYILDSSLDSTKYTVMSYTDHPYSLYRSVTETSPGSYSWSYEYIQPETLMPLDIQALQYLYGANTGYHSGNDVYTFDPSRPFIKTIWDGGGNDTISVSNFSLGCSIDLRAGRFSCIRISSDPLPPGTSETHSGIYDGTDNLAIAYGVTIENAIGGKGKDLLTGNAAVNTLNGGAGADKMIGGNGSDSYYVDNIGDVVAETNASISTGGTDRVNSYLSAYTLGANVENGRILAGGAANLSGNSLNNVLYAGKGNNILSGSSGTDTVSYQYGVNGTTGVTVNLTSTNAQATGGSGSDKLISIERLIGSSNSDSLTGNGGANVLNGGKGYDALNGGAGNDLIIGGIGKDKLTGGSGNDSFDFNALNELGLGANRDSITDFTRGQDKIDLSTIDANASKVGDQSFIFVTGFTATAGQVRYSGSIVYLNTDTDTSAEFEIQLTGTVPSALSATDFVL